MELFRIMPGDKRPKVEVDGIVNQICIMMTKGITRRYEIFQYISKMDNLPQNQQRKMDWITVGDKTDRMIDHYISRAKDQFLELAKEDAANQRAMCLAQLEDLYAEARDTGKIQTANAIMKNKMYLLGVGGFNVNGNFNVKNFDVPLSPEAEKAYKERLKEIYGDDTFED